MKLRVDIPLERKIYIKHEEEKTLYYQEFMA